VLRENQKATFSDNQPMHLMLEHASLGATPVKPTRRRWPERLGFTPSSSARARAMVLVDVLRAAEARLAIARGSRGGSIHWFR